MIEVGQRLYTPVGNYEVEKTLGRGKTAEVYKGINTRDSADVVALKVAREGLEERVNQNFRREKEVLDRLEQMAPDSAYFPRALYQGKDDDNTPYLIMSLIEAKSLLEIAEAQPGRRLCGSLEQEQLAVDTATSYAHMLTILHKAGFAASDRKLDDILWNGEHVIVLDWNAVGSGETGQQHDLYQFGIFWHQLLMGVPPPRNGRSLRDQAGWENLTYGTRQILERALNVQLAARYPDAQTLWRALQILRADFYLFTKESAATVIRRAEERQAAAELIGAFTLLDILETHFDRGSYPAEAYSLWKELQAELAGQWGQIINQGVSHLQEGRFDRARDNFGEALAEAGDDRRYLLSSYRWRTLTQALEKAKMYDQTQLATAVEVVQAMDSGAWEKAASAAQQLEKNTLGPLLYELDLQLSLANAQASLDVRAYEEASAAYRAAQKSWEQMEVAYREKLGLSGLRQLISIADDLTRTEGAALSLLVMAQDKLNVGEQVAAEEALIEGYRLLQLADLRFAQSQGMSLPSSLDDEFALAQLRLTLQKKAAPERFLQDRIPVLFELVRDFQDPWAEKQLQLFRQELLGKLQGKVDLEAAEQPTNAVGYFAQDDEVISAIQNFKEKAQQHLEGKVQQAVTLIERLVADSITPSLVQAARTHLHRAIADVQLAQLHNLVPGETLASLHQKLQAVQQHINDADKVASLLREQAEQAGRPLTIGAGTIIELLEADIQAIQDEKEAARQRWREIAGYYLNAAETAAEQYYFSDALRHLETVLNLEQVGTAELSQAKALHANLVQEKQKLEQQSERLKQIHVQFGEIVEDEQSEIERLENLARQITVAISHPSLMDKVNVLQEVIQEKTSRLHQRRLRRELDQVWDLYDQAVDNNDGAIDHLERKVAYLRELTIAYSHLSMEAQELLGKVQDLQQMLQRRQYEALYARIYDQLEERVPDWQEVFALLHQLDTYKEQGEISLPQRWLNVAETHLAHREYAPALQLAYYARRYYERAEQDEHAEKAAYLESKALTSLHDQERLHKLANTYLDEARHLYRNEKTKSVQDLDRAMTLVGWAILFDPTCIEAVQKEKDIELMTLFETWQHWRERHREAYLFYERCQRIPPPPLEDRLRWLQTAADLLPGEEQIGKAFYEAQKDAEAIWEATNDSFEKTREMLIEGRYSQVEANLSKMQEDLALLERLAIDDEEGRDKNIAEMKQELAALKKQVELARKTDELYMPFRGVSHWNRVTIETNRPALAALGRWVRKVDTVQLPELLKKELRDLSGKLQKVVNESDGRDDETLIFTRLQIPVLQASVKGESNVL